MEGVYIIGGLYMEGVYIIFINIYGGGLKTPKTPWIHPCYMYGHEIKALIFI